MQNIGNQVKQWVTVAAVAVVALCGTAAHAAIISVNFVGDGGTSSTLAAGDVVGVSTAANWNNVSGASGSAIALADSTASSTSVTMAFNAPRGAGSGYLGSPTTPFGKLFNGAIRANSEWAAATSVTLSGLSSLGASCDLIVYYSGGEGWATGRTAELSVGSTTYYVSSIGNGSTENYVQGTSTTSGIYDSCNYVQFSGLTSNTLTLVMQHTANDVKMLGIQIVAVPEPATMAMFGLGLACLIRRRKQA